jgi:hypothetical protein
VVFTYSESNCESINEIAIVGDFNDWDADGLAEIHYE